MSASPTIPAVFDEIAQHRVVPVVAEADPDNAMRLTDALVSAGLPIAEITLRAPGAVEVLRAVAARGDVLPIAGTVLTVEQVDAVFDAGAKLIVSPGYSQPVVDRATKLGVPICSGVCTPSDVQAAFAAGLRIVKFFPAEAAGGTRVLKALAGPFPAMRFMPTGGISRDNLADYLAMPIVTACGGSWMVSPKLYADGDFGPVEQSAREAVELVASLS